MYYNYVVISSFISINYLLSVDKSQKKIFLRASTIVKNTIQTTDESVYGCSVCEINYEMYDRLSQMREQLLRINLSKIHKCSRLTLFHKFFNNLEMS